MKTLLLDIETAPNKVYAWGLYNQDIAINQIEEHGYTICWAAKWHGEDDIYFRSIQHGNPKRMLSGIHRLLDEADAVVHYNGAKFDLPVLNKEFLAYGFLPHAPVINIDLLQVVKKKFRFTSNKLDYVCGYLNLGNKVKHKGMDLWKGCMDGDEDSWEHMEEYNKGDLVLLERLYDRLLPWIGNHPNHALFQTDMAFVCPNCGSHNLHKRGTAYTKTMTYQRYQCQGCGAWSRERIANLPKERRKLILVGAN